MFDGICTTMISSSDRVSNITFSWRGVWPKFWMFWKAETVSFLTVLVRASNSVWARRYTSMSSRIRMYRSNQSLWYHQTLVKYRYMSLWSRQCLDSLGFGEQKVPIPRSPFNRGYLRRQEELEAQNSHASWPGLLHSFLDSKTPQEVITRPWVPWGSRISRPRHLPDQATPDQSRSRSRCILVPV